jgi:hypothetical protein
MSVKNEVLHKATGQVAATRAVKAFSFGTKLVVKFTFLQSIVFAKYWAFY